MALKPLSNLKCISVYNVLQSALWPIISKAISKVIEEVLIRYPSLGIYEAV